MQKIIWTKSGARLRRHSDSEQNLNWLFLPGGPGLGSESLKYLVEILTLPGTVWYVDFPGDGSNVSNEMKFANWQQALIEAVAEFENVILVAHSSGGMFALATPQIESHLKGLVLMDSAPDAGWQKIFQEYVENNPLPEALQLQSDYSRTPTDQSLKTLTIACAPYFATQKSMSKITAMLASLPFNSQSHLWAEKHFDATYVSKWVPATIPTLIFAGDRDCITPLKLFAESVAFKRNNILIKEIKNAGHFPWMDDAEAVRGIFAEYITSIMGTSNF